MTAAPARAAPVRRHPRLPADAPWWPDAVSLLAAMLGLGVALLGPRALPDTDPLGVDPFALRLAAVSLVLTALALASADLRPALPVQLAVGAAVLPFVLWSAVPRLLATVSGDALGYRTAVLVEDAAYLLAALALVAVCAAVARAPLVAWLRLRLTLGGVAAAVVTVAAMVVVFLAVPAGLVGRIAVPLAVLARDLPLLGPAYCLQAAAQELAFRGALLRTLERAAPPWAANLGQALLFGLAHIAVQYEGPTSSIVPVTVAVGLGLGWVTQRTGSVWPAVVAHAVLEVGQAYGVLPGLYGS